MPADRGGQECRIEADAKFGLDRPVPRPGATCAWRRHRRSRGAAPACAWKSRLFSAAASGTERLVEPRPLRRGNRALSEGRQALGRARARHSLGRGRKCAASPSQRQIYAAKMSLLRLALWVLDHARGVHQQRRRVRLAFFVNGRVPFLFVNVVNLSHDREIEITHVWFDVEPEVNVVLDERPLPKRLQPDESWETWTEAAKLVHESHPETLARVRLSSGKVIKSRRTRTCPPLATSPVERRAGSEAATASGGQRAHHGTVRRGAGSDLGLYRREWVDHDRRRVRDP